MSKYLAVSAVVALLSALLGVWMALANPYQGNPLDWDTNTPNVIDLLLQQNLIGSASASGDRVDVCSDEFPTTAYMVPDIWNSSLGFTAFRWRDTCDGLADVAILTIADFTAFCPDWFTHACTYPTAFEYADYDLRSAWVVLNPNGHNGIPWADGNDPHTLRDVTHELGHVLGMGEYHGCAPGGAATVMDTNETCLIESDPRYGIPQSVDTNNYHLLYHADHVQNLTGSSPSAGTVHLTWSQTIPGDGRTIPNEASFGVWLQQGSDWLPQRVENKNAQESTISGQTPGSQWYKVCSNSYADNQHNPISDCTAPVNVIVAAPGADLIVTDYSPKASTSGGTLYVNEGGSQVFRVWVKNQGSVTAPVSTVVMEFNDGFAPNPYGGVCNVGTIAPGATTYCDTVGVSLTIPGGHIDVIADYNNVVTEVNESNNTYTWGKLGVVPKASSNVRVYPPWTAYAWTDQSAIETQFKIELERVSSSSCSGTWVHVPGTDTEGHSFPYYHPAISGSGTDHVMTYSYAHGYCYRLRVTPKSQFGGDGTRVTSSTYWYP